MKIDFTKDEVEYFKTNCYFSDEEEIILEKRLKNESITKIALELHYSERTIKRRINSIKRKILKVI
jgi:DNA-binding NarL/FixJ family response regulator